MAVRPARERPAGSVPANILHVYGVLPPPATSVWMYAQLAVPSERDAVLTLNPENTVTDKAFVLTAPLASVACIVKLLVPAVVGVPLISPVAVLRLSPAGSTPALNIKKKAASPPLSQC